MPRKPRNTFSNGFFHVVCQGLKKEFIFHDSHNKNYYFQLVSRYCKKFSVIVVAYCIMDNHAHFLFHCDNISNMSLVMKYANTLFATFYNKRQNRVGYVFRNRFYSEIIKNEKHLYSCVQYIHLNPVKAHIIHNPENYKFSSCKDYINQTGIISDVLINLIFNGNLNYLDKIVTISDSLYPFFFFFSYTKPGQTTAYKIIHSYINRNNLDINVIKADNNLLKNVCHDLIHFYKIKQIDISNYFNISTSKINRMSI